MRSSIISKLLSKNTEPELKHKDSNLSCIVALTLLSFSGQMWLGAMNLKTSFTFRKSLLYSCDITSAMWTKCKCFYTSKHKQTGETGLMGQVAAVSTQRSNLKPYHQGNTVMLTEMIVHLLSLSNRSMQIGNGESLGGATGHWWNSPVFTI